MANFALPSYDDRYPPPYLSVDVVVLTIEDGVLKVLLDNWVELGLVLPHEIAFEQLALEDIAARHIERRIGLSGIELEHTGVTSAPGRDYRGWVISIAFMGVAEPRCLHEVLKKRADLRLVSARFNHSDCTCTLHIGKRRIEAAFDQEAIIGRAIQALRDKLDTSMLAFRFLPKTFTVLELRQIHETILGHKLKPVTFRKRMLARIFADGRELIDTGRIKVGPHRPAAVHRLG